MIEVDYWLKNAGSYEDGIAILKRYNPKSIHIRIFERSNTEFNRRKLFEMITELYKSGKIGNYKDPEKRIQEVMSDAEWKSAPDRIKDLNEEAKKKFKECARIHSNLVRLTHEAKEYARPHQKNEVRYINAINSYLKLHNAGLLANQLLDMDDEVADMFYKIDYWKLHNRLPDESASVNEISEPLHELERKLRNLRARRSKIKKKENAAADLLRIEEEIVSIEKKVNGLI